MPPRKKAKAAASPQATITSFFKAKPARTEPVQGAVDEAAAVAGPCSPVKAAAAAASCDDDARASPRLKTKARPSYTEQAEVADEAASRPRRTKKATASKDFSYGDVVASDDDGEMEKDPGDDGEDDAFEAKKPRGAKKAGPKAAKPRKPAVRSAKRAAVVEEEEEEDVAAEDDAEDDGACDPRRHAIQAVPPAYREAKPAAAEAAAPAEAAPAEAALLAPADEAVAAAAEPPAASRRSSRREVVAASGASSAFDLMMNSKQPAPAKKPRARATASLASMGTDAGDEKFSADLDNDLPVLSRPADIFADVVRRFPALGDFAKRQARPLRIATMCSGTEAPLIALELTSQACATQFGAALDVQHVFSSEVEPFKQAYIQRNFAPKLLFRDVRELGDKQAHTAFGALEDVPQQRDFFDMLVAGTSCVDYSNLNDRKKQLDEGGESGQTFYGMFEWVQRARPAFVLLENVCGAPWPGMKKNFASISYHARHIRLDTKHFYLPQTRTRGYMLAVAHERCGPEILDHWEAMVMKMRRPASASLEAFMLAADDARVSAARDDLKHTTRNKNDVPWDKCEARHARVRSDEKLGQKRPVTNWSHGTNNAQLPDFAWRDWAQAQTERVLDSIDIHYMRLVKEATDPNFKTSVWDLSQNVDRINPVTSKLGICPCLTPSLCAYVTNQGRPVIGVETLALQGIPIDDLLLTRESEDNLTSLSGNAMSTTVVGAAMLAAMMCLPDAAKLQMGLVSAVEMEKVASMLPSAAMPTAVVVDESTTAGAEPLVMGAREPGADDADAMFGAGGTVTYASLQRAAELTCRRCFCESRGSNAAAAIRKCAQCGHTACAACAGRPEHDYADCGVERLDPKRFEAIFAHALPAQLRLRGVTRDALKVLVDAARASKAGDSAEDDGAWLDALDALDGAHFRLAEVTRGASWRASFVDATGALHLELHVDALRSEWLVSVDPPSMRGALRDRLKNAVLRGTPSGAGGLMDAVEWTVRLPWDDVAALSIESTGPVLGTFSSTFAMEDETRGQSQRSRLVVSGCADIDGTYEALPRCAAALTSLHKRVSAPEQRDVYCFLESQPVGPAFADGYVFARDWRKLHLGESRASTIATLSSDWRPPLVDDAVGTTPPAFKQAADASIAKWVAVGGALEAAAEDGVVSSFSAEAWRASATAKGNGAVDLETASPFEMVTVLQASVPLGDVAGKSSVWNAPDWAPLSAARLGSSGRVAARTAREIGFLTPRLVLPAALEAWQTVSNATVLGDRLALGGTCCAVCAPTPPSLQWAREAGKRAASFVAVEDPYSAGIYERALKDRPPTFAMHARLRGGDGDLRIAVNATALATRAFASLPASIHARALNGGTKLEWRLTRGETTHCREREAGRPFALSSNRGDAPAAQPAAFVAAGAPLRPEQLRSLTWMLEMERGVDVVEEEVVDETLSALGWRAEARVQVSTRVRGGVLADAVGYGKTAITLALVDETRRAEPPELPAYLKTQRRRSDGFPDEAADPGLRAIPCKATLIVVPKHLMAQWPAELKKFLGKRSASYKVITIASMKDFYALTVAKVLEADIIFVAVSTFRSEAYFDHLSAFASVHQMPKKGGRYFEEVHGRAVANVERYVGILTNKGPQALRAAQQKDRALLDVTIEVNTSKKQAYKDSAPKRGAREKSAPIKSHNVKKAAKISAPSDDDDDEMEEEEEAAEAKCPVDWRKVKAPPLHMFYFARKVVDEYTYLEARDVPTIQALKAHASWVLSGTPPLDVFDDVKAIAAFLGVHLGASDPVALTKRGTVAKRDAAKELSGSELFHEFLQRRSAAWHARRRDVAQAFVNRFVRQNVAEIEEIPFEEHLRKVELHSAERAVYLELEHHLRALEMQTSKHAGRGRAGAARSDREARLREALEGSGDAQEALLKRCAYSDFSVAGDGTVRKKSSAILDACENVVARRSTELAACEAQISREFGAAHRLEAELRRWYGAGPHSGPTEKKKAQTCIFEKYSGPQGMWAAAADSRKRKAGAGAGGHKHMRELHGEVSGGYGDPDSSDVLRALWAQAAAAADGQSASSKASPSKRARREAQEDDDDDDGDDGKRKKKKAPAAKEKKEAGDSDVKFPRAKLIADASYNHRVGDLIFPEAIPSGETEVKRAEREATLKELIWALRNHVYELRALCKEFVGRTRSLRFFEGIERAATTTGRPDVLLVDAVSQETLPLARFALLSCCGHGGDVDALRRAAVKEQCPVAGCKAAVRAHSVVACATFATDGAASALAAQHGAKLAEVVDLIESLPAGERVLVFVQFADLLTKVERVLTAQGIKSLKIKGTAHQMMAAMTAFQKEVIGKDDARVLLLELHNESASGANLTTANHAVFVHPLHVDKLQTYIACETQAIGRVRRYGQKKTVKLYRFLATDTIDTELYAMRKAEVDKRNEMLAQAPTA
ncbi:hypothetical protein M885DRAFT_613323 [Pelagophyceae sp. CCMP2097]|nr:hypothetical protein M885DRAFT_613323 [Pelagophyceae sp. CCMP2097]